MYTYLVLVAPSKNQHAFLPITVAFHFMIVWHKNGAGRSLLQFWANGTLFISVRGQEGGGGSIWAGGPKNAHDCPIMVFCTLLFTLFQENRVNRVFAQQSCKWPALNVNLKDFFLHTLFTNCVQSFSNYNWQIAQVDMIYYQVWLWQTYSSGTVFGQSASLH